MTDTLTYITIVSGLPRSGTSMMMRMLEAGGLPVLVDHVRAPDEDNPRGYYEFEPVKKTKQDPSWIPQARGKVVKMVYRLLYDLPDDEHYRVIFMRRHMMEVIKSQDVMLERKGKPKDALTHEQLLSIYEKQLSEFDAWVRTRQQFQILDAHYNQILQEPTPIIDQINQLLDGRLDTQAMLQVVEPSLHRQKL